MNEEMNNNIVNNETNSNNNYEPPKSNNGVKVLLLVLIVLVLFLIGLTAYKMLVFDKKNDNKQSNNVVTEKKEEKTEKIETQEIEKVEDKERNGKELTIYYSTYDDSVSYYCDNRYNNSQKKAKFKCVTNNCECIDAAKDYILVEEDNKYSLYNYIEDKLIISDFADGYVFKDSDELSDDDFTFKPSLESDSKGNPIALIYAKDYISKIYSFSSNKVYSNIKGYVNIGPDYNGYYKFKDHNIIYLIDYSDDSDNINSYLFNLNTGKIALNNPNLSSANKDNFVLKTNKSFIVYDYSFNKVYESKTFDEFLMSGEGFALVVEGKNLNLVDLKGNLLTTFLTDYSKDKYSVHTLISGWYEQNNKNGIYIVIGQEGVTVESILKDNPNMSEEDARTGLNEGPAGDYNGGYEYYYIPSTKETGKIATYVGGYAKPVLYLYPKESTNVTVTFEHPEWLTTTYPKYTNSWEVTAVSNGTLTDKSGRKYYALYWEELKNHDIDFEEGFYVDSKDVIPFLEEKLEIIGLNEREANEFIMYWLPILENNGKNLIYFELTEERDSYNKLIINPKPDSILRVAMHVKKVNNKTNIKEQKLETFNRTGFSAIEWGGVIHK